MLKVEKWYTMFKTVNYFPKKIKKEFSVKRKIFSLATILRYNNTIKYKNKFLENNLRQKK
jgi:hypothetical protein